MDKNELFNKLKEGVDIWNEWRLSNPDEEIDLSGIEMIAKDLSDVDFSHVKLNKANLTGSDLSYANLTNARLINAELGATTIDYADLSNANLNSANLRGAELRETNLSHVDFGEANLVRVNLTGSILTGIDIYGAARDDWVINNVICDYILLDGDTNKRTPKDRNFRLGEFEELYKQLPMFEYIFEQGVTLLDMAIINQIVNDIRDLHPEWDLNIDSFQARAQPRAVFTIVDSNLISYVFDQIKLKYESALSRLEGRREESNKALAMMIKELTSNPKIGEITMGDTYNNYGQTASMGKEAIANHTNNQQIILNDNNLDNLRNELLLLKEKIQEINHLSSDDVSISEINKAIEAANNKDANNALKHIKKLGRKTLEISEKIGISLVTEILKQHFGL